MEIMLALQEALDGRYWLDSELGRGGMGIVYLAWEPDLERKVALKILPPDASEHRRARFLREAPLAARLRHDHIVPIHTVGEAGPFVYYTMDYIEGETLGRRILTEGAVPVGDATRILHDVARAVHYAHTKGVVHRDLKPTNILIEAPSAEYPRGRAYVADFGLARALSDGLEPDAGGTFGTCHFASPEQAAGLPTDHRSDVYALGVLGYVMATGQPLFEGSDEEILQQHVSHPAPVLGVHDEHLDTTLAAAVRRCVAKDPADRFQTAGDLALALSLAPALRTELDLRLRTFVSRLRVHSNSVPLGVAVGLGAVGVLWRALQSGAWLKAGAAGGFLALLAASPLVTAFFAARELRPHGYARVNIVHALEADRARQRKQLGHKGKDAVDKVGRIIVVGAWGVFGLGLLGAMSGLNLPADLVMWSIVTGMLTGLVGGVFLIWRERKRNELWGGRWLRFWDSGLGEWTVKLASVGLGDLPEEPTLPEPDAVVLAPPSEPPARLPSERRDLAALVERSETLVRRGRDHLAASAARRARGGASPSPEELGRERTLERQLVVLEALLQRLRTAEPGTVGAASLEQDFEKAREICDMVEAMIEVGL